MIETDKVSEQVEAQKGKSRAKIRSNPMAQAAGVRQRRALPILAFSIILLAQSGAKIAVPEPPNLDGRSMWDRSDSTIW
jgi:hypothetical protein